MSNNAICKQIPWDKNPIFLAAWEKGETGYPWIDACMTQLRRQVIRYCVELFNILL
jgi:cryptochrome